MDGCLRTGTLLTTMTVLDSVHMLLMHSEESSHELSSGREAVDLVIWQRTKSASDGNWQQDDTDFTHIHTLPPLEMEKGAFQRQGFLGRTLSS